VVESAAPVFCAVMMAPCATPKLAGVAHEVGDDHRKDLAENACTNAVEQLHPDQPRGMVRQRVKRAAHGHQSVINGPAIPSRGEKLIALGNVAAGPRHQLF
jgi:hypothetical protein